MMSERSGATYSVATPRNDRRAYHDADGNLVLITRGASSATVAPAAPAPAAAPTPAASHQHVVTAARTSVVPRRLHRALHLHVHLLLFLNLLHAVHVVHVLAHGLQSRGVFAVNGLHWLTRVRLGAPAAAATSRAHQR